MAALTFKKQKKCLGYVLCGCLRLYSAVNSRVNSYGEQTYCLDEKTYNFWSKLDYFGIALLISSSIITWVYFAFYTNDLSMIIYMVSTAILGFLVACLILTQNLNTPEKRFLRSVTFLIFGLLAVIPTFHYYLMDTCYKKTIPAMLMIGVFYVSGTVVYYLSVIAGSLSHFYALYMLAVHKTLNCNVVGHPKQS